MEQFFTSSLYSPPGSMEREPEARRSAVAPGFMTTVVKEDSMIAGPTICSPGRIASNLRT
jgi:hypothetical protein